MELWLWVCSACLFGIVVFLLGKLYYMKKAAREICASFANRRITDTNALLDSPSRDKDMRRLAAGLNEELREFRKQRHRYEQGDLELKNAVTNISHDLRTPLTAIWGYLDLLEKEAMSEPVSRYVEMIRNRAALLTQLTEELFRYSVLLTTEENLEKEPVELNRALEESIVAFYASLTERGIVPKIRLTEKKIIRQLDRSALSRVFSNLLNNAIKYSDGDLEISLSEKGEILFSNHASGLDEVQVGRLFDRFYTVETARNSTGLGLSIARTLVERMHGTITAEYAEGRLFIRLQFSLVH